MDQKENMGGDCRALKILIYDDNPDFGGHQIMACHAVEALAEDTAIKPIFMLNPKNIQLVEMLKSIQEETHNLELLESPCNTQKFQGLRNHFSGPKITELVSTFRPLMLEKILLIQGEIEDSSLALLAAKRAGLPCISYIPIPHTMDYMGARLGALRDRINGYLFSLPDRFITISESMKQLLQLRGAAQPISIVLNGIPPPPLEPPPAIERLPGNKTIIGSIGRIEFNQKQQHFLVKTFCDFPDAFANCHLLIAGGGPDELKLKRLIESCPRKEEITLIEWQKSSESFYASIDVLMIPSRFEGVPLVMLEAIARGIPVLGSRRDGMQDLLPPEWTFPTENAEEMAAIFSAARNDWSPHTESLQTRVLQEMSLSAFKTAFHKAITDEP
jgi:glycosyltransferase involved in cell wall biosynthesis